MKIIQENLKGMIEGEEVNNFKIINANEDDYILLRMETEIEYGKLTQSFYVKKVISYIYASSKNFFEYSVLISTPNSILKVTLDGSASGTINQFDKLDFITDAMLFNLKELKLANKLNNNGTVNMKTLIGLLEKKESNFYELGIGSHFVNCDFDKMYDGDSIENIS